MKTRQGTVFLIACFVLQGCSTFSSNTDDDVRNDDGAKSTFTVPLDFDTVVRNEFCISDTCPSPELTVGGFISRHYFDQERRIATITYGVDGPTFGYHIWQVIDVTPKGSETEIHTYVGKTTFNGSLQELAHKAREWALGSKDC